METYPRKTTTPHQKEMQEVSTLQKIDNYLRDRWKGYEKELQEVLDISRTDPDWYKSGTYKDLMAALPPMPSEEMIEDRDLRGANVSGADLEGANLSNAILMGANLSGAFLMDANLSGASLVKANLLGAALSGANLSGADLHDANFSNAILDRANLSKTKLWANLSGASLVRANLWNAILMGANLSGAFLAEANFSGADLRRANFSNANLVRANLSGAVLDDANLSGALLWGILYTTDEVFNRLITWWGPQILSLIPFVKHSKKWKQMGITNFIRVDTSKINGATNPILKRHIEDFQFILGFKEKTWFHRRVFYPLWKMTSDCGRSLLLWFFWSVGLVGLFTYLYSKNLNWFAQSQLAKLDWFNALYFSIVTFTTLGFGDLSPNLTNRTAQAWVIAQVIIGYIMLGGLVSILANKLARRA